MTAAAATPLPEYVSVREFAKVIRVHPNTLRGWVHQGRIPSPRLIGRRHLWPRDVVLQFLDSAPLVEPSAAVG